MIMNWDSIKPRVLWGVVAFTVLNIVMLGWSEVIVRRTEKRVIERLSKPYSPSPYGPGLDPDKVNPDALKKPAKTADFDAPVPQKDFRFRWEDERLNP
jgi:hypothetical protein